MSLTRFQVVFFFKHAWWHHAPFQHPTVWQPQFLDLTFILNELQDCCFYVTYYRQVEWEKTSMHCNLSHVAKKGWELTHFQYLKMAPYFLLHAANSGDHFLCTIRNRFPIHFKQHKVRTMVKVWLQIQSFKLWEPSLLGELEDLTIIAWPHDTYWQVSNLSKL